jgi:KDO2-lipid IV(A) lauroyltransferase
LQPRAATHFLLAAEPSGRVMKDLSYSFRASAFSNERTYRLGADGLEWHEGSRPCRLAYAEVDKTIIYKVRFAGSSATHWRCVLGSRFGGKVKLCAASYTGWRRVEDRIESYMPFVKELEARIAAANPDCKHLSGRNWFSALEEFFGHVAVRCLRAMRYCDRCADLAAWVMRRVGPRLRGHRTARAQVTVAFPEKSAVEIEQLLAGMWDNLARTVVEYSVLDRLWDHDPARPESGRILVAQDSIDRWSRLVADKRPALGFAAHLANWELAAIAMAAHGRETLIPQRAPKIKVLADELVCIRMRCGYTPIPEGAESFAAIRKALGRGALIGALVDQYYAQGMEVTFFGRRCKINPIFGRLARIFDARIYGARVIRLPDRRFRYEIEGPIEPVRDSAGKIDVAGTMQVIASIMERWIREHPEQWMWLHRMWR